MLVLLHRCAAASQAWQAAACRPHQRLPICDVLVLPHTTVLWLLTKACVLTNAVQRCSRSHQHSC